MPLLRFSKDDPSHTIEINQDDPYLKITKAIMANHSDDGETPSGISAQIFNHTTEGSMTENISLNESTDEQNVFPINRILVKPNDFQHQKVKLEIDENEINGGTLELHYEIKNLDVSIESPWREFKEHLQEGGNNRILFSAPYGQGKTTFLKQFFKKENEVKKQFEVFHLFPVNYAISANEDIFRYIKTEILFQLLGRDVEFDKERFTYLQTLPKFVFKNADRILAPFLRTIPKIGESAFGVYENLRELTQEYFSEHDRLQIDDKDAAEKFIQKAYEEEGSIYEDNFYSQLIRQLLEQLKGKGRKTVLIIDDTDRMDPDHIFRILNVFAAHFDSPNYEKGDSNKFGFDKIIVVCDYDNLHKIFCHKYGASTDFAGYIDKFYSKQIFRYDNLRAIQDVVYSIINNKSTEVHIYLQNFNFVITDLVRMDLLSLRDVLKLKKRRNILSNFNRIINLTPNGKAIELMFPTIYLLHQLFNFDTLISKIDNCILKITDSNRTVFRTRDYESKALDLCINFIIEKESSKTLSSKYPIRINDQDVVLKIESEKITGIMIEEKTDFSSITLKGKTFTASDFYAIFKMVVELYDKLNKVGLN